MSKLHKQATTPNRLAFLVGVKDYEQWNPLDTPLNDIREVGNLLASSYGYDVHSIENPSLERLQDFFQKAAATVEDTVARLGDEPVSVLFYYAGHGYQLSDERGFDGYLIPADADLKVDALSWYPLSNLMEWLGILPCRHLLLVLDCCHSGSVRWASKMRDRGIVLPGQKLYRQHYENFTLRRSFQAMVSTSLGQTAFDSIDNSVHSPFAHQFLEGLRGAADTPPDKVITCPELFAFIQLRLGAVAGQNAGLIPLGNHDQGEYFFFIDGFDPKRLDLLEFDNPYKGLNAYEKSDTALFFGRSNAIELLLEKVRKQSLTVVVGASGSGKSSLVQAGVLPRLKTKSEIMSPGRSPLAEAEKLGDFEVLMIDQFEQLITQSDKEAAAPFFQKIETWLQSGKKIMVTVRNDFEKQLPLPESLNEAWEAGRFRMPLFSAEEYREIIVAPARRVGWFVTPLSFVDSIVDEVLPYPGSLPLLSFTMQQLFKECEGDPNHEIGKKAYDDLKGVTGALQSSADRVYERLNKEERMTMRHLMLRMVSLSGGETAGRRVLKSELEFDDLAENLRITKVLKLLEDERLIHAGEDSEGNEFYEPSHDALVQVWGQMQEWIKEFTSDNILLQARLDAAQSEYFAQGSRWNQLWLTNPNRRLVLKAQKSAGIPLALNRLEKQFIERSHRVNWRIWSAAVVILLAVITGLSGLTLWATSEQYRAEQNAKTAIKNQEKADIEAERAKQSAERARQEKERAKQSEAKAKSEEAKAKSALEAQLAAERKEKTERLNKLITEGNAYRQGKKFEEAIKSYQDALDVGLMAFHPELKGLIDTTKKEKNDHEFDQNLSTGLALIDAYQYKAALPYLEKARKSRPDNDVVKQAIAKCKK